MDHGQLVDSARLLAQSLRDMSGMLDSKLGLKEGKGDVAAEARLSPEAAAWLAEQRARELELLALVRQDVALLNGRARDKRNAALLAEVQQAGVQALRLGPLEMVCRDLERRLQRASCSLSSPPPLPSSPEAPVTPGRPSPGPQQEAPPSLKLPPAKPQPHKGPAGSKVPPPSTKGARRAVLCGCNYPGTASELRGCHNDVETIRGMLVRDFGFQDGNITVLTDDPARPKGQHPTGANIKAQLAALVEASRPGDVAVFHFSGHGTQLPVGAMGRTAGDHDEADGLDEAIVPCDDNVILDDDLAEILAGLAEGVQFTSIFDCCHSENLLDHHQVDLKVPEHVPAVPQQQQAGARSRARSLPYEKLLQMLGIKADGKTGGLKAGLASLFGNDASAATRAPPAGKGAATRAGNGYQGQHLMLISGCKSHQTSADVSGPQGAYGALTNALSESVKAAKGQGKALSYRELLIDVRGRLTGMSQMPCLECAEEDQHLPFILQA